jgi:hypothetical protein
MSLLFLLVLVVTASAQDVAWVRQFGSPLLDRGRAVYTDGRATYVAGETTVTGASQAHLDAYVRKFDAQGVLQWTRTFGTEAAPDGAFAISGDDSSVYVAGFVSGALPGQSPLGQLDVFLRKYDANGAIVWTRQFGTAGSDSALAVAVEDGFVYVGGFTTGTFPGQTSFGGTDAFVAKFSSQGSQIWLSQFGTAAVDQIYGVAPDKQGGVAVAGVTSGSLGGPNQGLSDAFVRRLSASNGSDLWTQQFGTTAIDTAVAVAADRTGIYVGGSSSGSLTSAGSAGGSDGYVRRYTLSGSADWIRLIRTNTNDEVTGLSLSGDGLFAAGNTETSLPGQKAAGRMDGFVKRYDCDGATDWTLQFGTPGNDSVRALSVKGSRIAAAGVTDGQFKGQVLSGQVDGFVIRINE